MLILANSWSDSIWNAHTLAWVLFNAFVLVMLMLDLFVFHRHAHVIRMREAVLWSIFWIALALVFALVMHFWYEPPADATDPASLARRGAAMKYLTGYVVEKSLSVDNLFVFLVLFSYFAVPAVYQHRVLFWGIVGALVMRIVFIVLGVALINRLHWLMFVFGGFLVFTGVKMALKSDEEVHPERNPVLRLARKFLPITHEYHQGSFFTRVNGKLFVTPLFIVLLVVETTDVMFAVDSVPAVIGVIQDPRTKLSDSFIAYTSNVFAILGLRALYFALSGLMQTFHLLHYGLAAILSFVGVKMLIEAAAFYSQRYAHQLPAWAPLHVEIPTWLSLAVIGGVLAAAVALSLMFPQKVKVHGPPAGTASDPLHEDRK
jgi:tellurite resistance protein TerC